MSMSDFQKRVNEWMRECFGREVAADVTERNHRFIEEALELVQANGCTKSEALQLVDYVYGRPAGDVGQEVGGVMLTLTALCTASGQNLVFCSENELTRVHGKITEIREKQATKPSHSPLPEQVPACRSGPEHFGIAPFDGTPAKVTAGDYTYEGELAVMFRKKRGGIRCIVEDEKGRLFVHNTTQVSYLSGDAPKSAPSQRFIDQLVDMNKRVDQLDAAMLDGPAIDAAIEFEVEVMRERCALLGEYAERQGRDVGQTIRRGTLHGA